MKCDHIMRDGLSWFAGLQACGCAGSWAVRVHRCVWVRGAHVEALLHFVLHLVLTSDGN